MTLKIYSIYDSKAEAYNQPFYMRNKGEAIRAWQQTVNDKTTQFYSHPGDFTLFELGEFDDSTASIKCYDTKINLGTALEHKSKLENEVTSPRLLQQLQEASNA